MFGNHFYNQRIRKAVAVFGSLFNDINVVRKSSSGATISQVKVPLSYAPKRDFLARIDAMQNGEDAERQIAVKLPRMSFEIIAMTYDAARQLPKINSCKVSGNDPETANRLYTPVPYNVSFQLSIFTKSQDDALQIVEQIIPYFTPTYTVTVNPLDDRDIKEDTPITLTGITFSDDFEAPIEARRSIVYTLDFDMKIQLYKDASSSIGIIDQASINFVNLDNLDEVFSIVRADSAFAASPLSGTTLEDNPFSQTFTVRNVPSTVTSIEITEQAEHGTASALLQQVLVNNDGVIEAIGVWSYAPDDDYSGLDTFTIGVTGEFGTKTYPISITVTSVEDAFDYSVSTTQDTSVEITLDNNLFSGSVTYVIAVDGEPTDGTVEILDASLGVFRYTPNAGFVGNDSFIYRANLPKGSSEVGQINIQVV